jgi:hypothetical protein
MTERVIFSILSLLLVVDISCALFLGTKYSFGSRRPGSWKIVRFPGLLRRKEYRGLFWIEVAMEIVMLYVLVARIMDPHAHFYWWGSGIER